MREQIGRITGIAISRFIVAALILIVGWLIARAISSAIRAILHRVRVGQRLVQWIAREEVMKPDDAERWVAKLVYYLVMLFVLVAFFQAVGLTIITEPLVRMMNQILESVPRMLAAALLLLTAWVAASVLRFVVIRLLRGARVDERLKSLPALKNMQLPASEIVGQLARVAIMLFASIEAARAVGMVVLSDLLTRFMISAGHVLIGLVIFAVGLYLANLASRTILASGMVQSRLVAFVARVAIIVLSAAMGLRQMDLANEIVNTAFTALLGAIAVAVALAFGLGGREVAARELERWVQSAKGRQL